MKRPHLLIGSSLAFLLLSLACTARKNAKEGHPAPSSEGAPKAPHSVIVGLAKSGASLLDQTFTEIKVKLVCDGYPDDDKNPLVDVSNGQPLTVYGSQTHCTLRLVSFKAEDLLFNVKSGAGVKDFTTWAAGDTATFESNVTGVIQEATVTVVTQLPDTLTGDFTVSYTFAQLIHDADVPLDKVDISVSDITLVLSGDDAPPLRLVKAQLVSLTGPATGLRLVVGCAGQFSGSTLADAKCNTDQIGTSEIHVGDLPAGDLTNAALDALFKADARQIATIAGAKIIAGGGEALNGGVSFTLPLSALGIAKWHELSGKKLLFAIREAASHSYRYSVIDVPQLTDQKDVSTLAGPAAPRRSPKLCCGRS